MADHAESKLWDMIADIRTCMLTAKRGALLESRPMSAFIDKEARAIWFLTELGSDKTREIEADGAVNLAFTNESGQTYVSLSGDAKVLRDVAKQKELWSVFAEAWMPEGPEAANVGLIRVDPVEATYWDSPGGKLVQLWRVAVANVTQSPPKGDEVKKVSF